MTRLLAVILILSLLSLMGCNVSKIVFALNVAAIANAAASDLIAGANDLPAGLKLKLQTSLRATSRALAEAADDLQSGTITAAQIAAISNELAAAMIVDLPAGVSPTVKAVILAVSGAVGTFLSLFQNPTTAKIPVGAQAMPQHSYTVKLSRTDRAKLAEAQKALKTVK